MEQNEQDEDYMNPYLINRGYNFHNIEGAKEETYFIGLMLETTQDWEEQEEEWVIK